MTRTNELGFSLIELLLVVAIILIIAAIAIPSFLGSRMSANEASAVQSVRSIVTAQISYNNLYPDVGYATSLDKLGPTSGVVDKDHAGLVADSLATAPYQHSGYTLNTTGDATSFKVTAVPITLGTTGRRSFCSDTPGVIYYSYTTTCIIGQNVL